MQVMINPCGGLHFGMTKCLKSTILFLFKLSVPQSKLFIFQVLLIHDITSSDHNAQLVALGIALRGGRGRTYQAHDQNNSIRERYLLLKNISKEKLEHFLLLHRLFHQNFYFMLEVAAFDNPVEVRLPHVPPPTRSKSEQVFPIHTHTHVRTYSAWAQPASQPRVNTDRKHSTQANKMASSSSPLWLSRIKVCQWELYTYIQATDPSSNWP